MNITNNSPEKSLSPSVVEQFGNISFQRASQTNLFDNNNTSNTLDHSHNNIIRSNKKSDPLIHESILQTDHQRNQENTNPNISLNQRKEEKQKPDKTRTKTKWKQEFNKLIRSAKEYESKKQRLLSLKTYIRASKLSPKPQSKLDDKIERVQNDCYDRGLHETEEAFEQIDSTPWYLNIVTENYHIERERKDDDDDDDDVDDDDELEFVLPGDIYDKLYNYQRECLVWFWQIYQSRNGGILGDDMGLGKTVQMSAFLHGAFLSGLIKCCLLIVPVSVMQHWIKELNKWCDAPGFRIRKYHSSISKKRRRENLSTIGKRGGVLMTTYGMVQKNFALMDLENITERKWDYMVLDEGHKIKNHLIGTSKAVRQIPVKNSNKIILSGTFLQNELSELWSLFDFISEGSLFGSYKAFNEEFATKINAGRLKNASLIQKQISNKLLNLIKKTVKPYLLRRTKAEIRQKQQEKGINKKELTPILQCQKRELVIWIKLSSIQIDLYRTFLESDAVKETLNTTKSPLAALTVLKKICDHPFLLSDKMANCTELTRLTEITKDRSIDNTLSTSNKMYVLLAILKQLIHNKHRILVFSQYKIILSMIEAILKENKMQYLRMDGDTAVDQRQKLVEGFNKSKTIDIFLLSTRVGGLGLNLVGADRVIIYDPAWNPATDAQAVDRSYRIGQLKDVMVYRFVTCGTIEEKIYRRQISKVGLLKSVTGHSNQHRYFSKAQLKEVFKLENVQESETQIQFKQLHQHRIGTNADFDRESDYVEHIQYVYGISHHDLLFRTCPKEELEENPELAKHIKELQKKLSLQTPKPTTRRKNKPETNKKINDLLEGKLDLSNIMPTKTNEFKFKFNTEYQNDNDNSLDSSNPMDIDVDDDNNDEMNNVSFISNVSSIHSLHKKDENSNSWTDNECIQSTAKKTRTLRKKLNRFIADSDSDDVDDNNNGFNAFPQNRTQFNFLSTPSTNTKRKQISSNVIMQTPILAQYKKKSIIEDHGIDMTDIVKVIRSQPKRRRRKSMANLKQLLDAEASDGDNENKEEYDSEATISETENDPPSNNNYKSNSFIFDNNSKSNQSPNQQINDSNHNTSKHNEAPNNTTNHNYNTTNPWQQQPQQSPINDSNHNSFIFDNNSKSNQAPNPWPQQSTTIDSNHNPCSPSNSNSFIPNPWQQQPQQSTPNDSNHNSCSPSNSNSFVFDNKSKSNEAPNPWQQHQQQTPMNNNPYLDDNLMKTLDPFSVEQNKSFEHLYRVSDTNNNNIEPQTKNTLQSNDEFDDEETVSDEDQEMVDLNQSVTAHQIFETTEKELSIESYTMTPLKSASPDQIKQLSTNYKRYRRKSFIPQIEEYDFDDEETEDEEEPQQKEKGNNDNDEVRVCEQHERRANQVEGFEYKCTKCECYMSEEEKVKYKQYLQMADDAEKQEDWAQALLMTMNALGICNSNGAVHAKCLEIGKILKIC